MYGFLLLSFLAFWVCAIFTPSFPLFWLVPGFLNHLFDDLASAEVLDVARQTHLDIFEIVISPYGLRFCILQALTALFGVVFYRSFGGDFLQIELVSASFGFIISIGINIFRYHRPFTGNHALLLILSILLIAVEKKQFLSDFVLFNFFKK